MTASLSASAATATVPGGTRSGTGAMLRRRLGALAFLIILGYLVLMPVYRLQEEAFSDGAAAYRREFGRATMGETILSTVGLGVGSLIIALVLGTALGWAATRLPPRLRFLRILPMLPMVLPTVASVLGWSFLLSPRPGYLNAALRLLPWWDHLIEGPIDVYTLPWIVIITGLNLTAFVYLFVSAGFSNINSELIESAHVNGSGGFEVFVRVILPLLRPALVYGGAVALLLGLGQFTAPLLLGRSVGVQVLTTEMYLALTRVPQDPAAAAAIASPLLIFGIVVVMVQKYVLGNQSRFVTHGGKSFRPYNRTSKLAVTMVSLYVLVATVLPIAGLLIVSISPFWSREIEPSLFTLDNFRQLFDTPALTEAIWNSIFLSLCAVLISLPIGFIAASMLLKAKRMKVTRTVLDVIVALPLGIPAAVFGVGFLLTYTRDPFFLYGTRWVILVVYVTLMLPFTTRMHMSGMIALGDSYLEASRVSGAGVMRTNLKVVVPLLRGTIGGAAALMFVLLTHEFAASLLVRAPTTQVMGTVLFDYYVNGSYPLVASIAVIMTGVTFAGVVLAMVVGGADILNKL